MSIGVKQIGELIKKLEEFIKRRGLGIRDTNCDFLIMNSFAGIFNSILNENQILILETILETIFFSKFEPK